MGDNRYHELLGLDVGLEQPTYYELLKLTPADSTTEVIEKSYKEQMTKLQHIKNPKHKGFIEFLKDELRNAKLTLSNPDKRKDYDKALASKHDEAFRQIVSPLLVLGELPKKVFEKLVQTGVAKHGLAEAHARKVIEEMAKAAGATIVTVEETPSAIGILAAAAPTAPAAGAPPPPPPPPAAPPPPPRPRPPAYAAAEEEESGDPLAFFDEIDQAMQSEAATTDATAGGDESMFSDHAPGTVAPPRRPETPPAPRTPPRPPAPPSYVGDAGTSGRRTPSPPAPAETTSSRIQRGNKFYDDSGPSARPGSSSSDASSSSSRRTPAASSSSDLGTAAPRTRSTTSGNDYYGRSSSPSPAAPTGPAWQHSPAPAGRSPDESSHGARSNAAANARAAFQSQQDAKVVDDARKAYNGGIKLSKLALAAHDALNAYFPRTGEIVARINGVSYEECFRTENKMWKEALPQFKKALDKLGSSQGGLADDLRARIERNVQNIEAYMKEWKDLKFKLEFQGVSKAEMSKLWSGYSQSRRSETLKQEIEKPSEIA